MLKKNSDLSNWSNSCFLAATALEEFWDPSKPIVFLGGWCKRYSQKLSHQYTERETLPLPYNDEDTGIIFSDLNGLYERILSELTPVLNDIHSVSHSKRYWSIFIGPWLRHYTHALYDRYLTIQMAIKRYPDHSTICLDKSCYIVPVDTADFMDLIKEDAYNLQIYSKILNSKGKAYPTKEFPVRKAKQDKNGLFSSFFSKIEYMSRCLFYEVWPIFYDNRKVIFKSSYFPKNIEISIIKKTKGIFWPYFENPAPIKTLSANVQARIKVAEALSGQNDFECLLVKLVAEDMPQIFIEQYQGLIKRTRKHTRRRPAAIFSATAWHYQDQFKEWAANSAEEGVLLVGTQHGGNYGSLKYFLQENHELSILDRFYSWGWTREGTYGEIFPYYATKLAALECIPNSDIKEKKEILYVTSMWPRYLIQFPWTYAYWDDCMKMNLEYYRSLSEKVKAHIRLRPHKEDFDWDVVARFKSINKNIEIESWDTPFLSSLIRSRLYICDHPLTSTTFIEALTIDKPAILFYNPRFTANMLHPGAEDFYDDLRSVGILFDNPRDAAEQTNLVFDYADEWWHEQERQKAVASFLNTFGKVSVNSADEWSEEFRNLSNKFKHVKAP